jgi:uncharacterized membrane protein YdjX (TVP38/TMEM64 family)
LDRAPDTPSAGGGWLKLLALAGAIVALFVLARVLGIGDRLIGLRDWIASLGPWAPVVYVVVYVAATVAMIPGSAITVLAGAVFGSLQGIVLVSISSTLGASLAFLIARYLARDTVSQWLKASPSFTALDELSERHGAVIVALTRLVPVFPFNFLNYGFGLTRVRFSTYVFWSWLCMLPGTVLYVVGADALVSGISEGRIPWTLLAVFLAAAVAVSLLVSHARKRLGREGGMG